MSKTTVNNAQNAISRARGPRGFGGPVEKAKDAKGTVLRIWRYMEKQKRSLIASIVFVVLATGMSLIAPYMIGVAIDEYIIPGDLSGTGRYLVLLAGVYLLSSVFTWLQTYMMVRVSLFTIRRLRQDLYDKFLSLSLRFFDKKAHGDLMSRVTNDIESLNSALSQSVIQIFSTVIMVTGVAIAMFSLNWIMALITLVIIPIMIYTTKIIIKHSSSNFIKRQRDLGSLNGFVEEAISGNEVVTLFGKEEKMFKEFSAINERLRQSAAAADTVSGFLGPINNFINNFGMALVIAAGAVMAVENMVTVGIIGAFVAYSRQFFRPINQLSSLINTFQSAIAGAERVFEVMDEEPEIVDSPQAREIAALKGKVEFSHVYFSYEPEKPILKDISFRAEAGEKIALVGPTGSGKTTIINLLMRFYDVNKGEIKIDGLDIREYRLKDLRKKIGIVLQDTFLFSGSILENIRYGRLDAADEEVVAAAKLASAHQFIKHLPAGYQTQLHTGGSNLSQGQRQLIAIARAILADADILILDEATSSIDTRTEMEIQNGMNRLMEGRTSFVIAHRLKTIENADHILVIKDGEIIETGKHQELLDSGGFYAEMYESQFNL